MNWRWSVLIAAAVCAALVVILAKGFGKDPHEVPFMLAGKPAPPFSLQKLDGSGKVSLSELKGRPVVINFWATWCGPCKVEHPVLDWGYRRYGREAEFLGVVFEDTGENTRAFLKHSPTQFPQLVDPQSQTAVDYGVAGVPETYFIDAQGIIRGKHVGPLSPDALTARIKDLVQPVAQAR
jgi:cytochrome c biogenesis protein CcmG/thiol:disulfide interchange protein DsbE